MKLSRKALREGIKDTPIEHILGADVSRKLTHKQRTFAHEVAKGATKADAYRTAYKPDATPASLNNDPYRIASDPRIVREIEAYSMALEAEKLRSPSALRALVIQSLTQVLIDPDTKPAVRINAAKVLGTVTEVAAFTERKEVRTISSSDDARARVMAELRGMLTSGATDATVIEADSLLAELAGEGAKTSTPAKTSAPDNETRTLEFGDAGSGDAEPGGMETGWPEA